SPQQTHSENVERLPSHIFRAHINDAAQPEQCADGSGGDAVLSRAGFSDNTILAHAPREQRLSDRVIDLMRAGVQKVFALQVNLCATGMCSQALRVKQRRRTTTIIAQ